MNDTQQYKIFAKQLAYEAGNIMRKYFGKEFESELKADNTIVTVADKEINDMVIQKVHQLYPDHDVDGEEKSVRCGSDYVWACDPIDGTAMFVMGLPVSVFSLALCVKGEPVLGVIYAPFSDALYAAEKGGGAFMNDTPIHVSRRRFGDQAEINVDWWPSAPWDTMSVAHDLAHEKGAYIIAPGSTTHSAALVARGGLVASVFSGTKGKNVDIAAAKIIVEEAGGKVTDIFGEEQRYDQDIRGAIVSNGLVHEEIVTEMKRRFL